MEEIDDSKSVVRQLTRIYDKFNEHFWENELPEVMITFSPKLGSHGHMSSAPMWISDTEENKYELNISAYTINRPAIDIAETVLHEQCHLYNIIHEIDDCCNYGRYHNKKFKETAEAHGLICTETLSYGYAQTKFNKDAVKFFHSLRIKKFTYRYERPKNPHKLMRYICPHCKDTTAWVSSKQFILCGYCKIPLIHRESSKNDKRVERVTESD